MSRREKNFTIRGTLTPIFFHSDITIYTPALVDFDLNMLFLKNFEVISGQKILKKSVEIRIFEGRFKNHVLG
jgi:hypothetical protein